MHSDRSAIHCYLHCNYLVVVLILGEELAQGRGVDDLLLALRDRRGLLVHDRPLLVARAVDLAIVQPGAASNARVHAGERLVD